MLNARLSVIFRADGDARRGLGHLVRSAALAEMLTLEFNCHLVYRDCPPTLCAGWTGLFANIRQLDESSTDEVDASDLARYAIDVGGTAAIVVLDGYHFGTDYQKIIVAAGLRLVCIDDIYHGQFLAHLIINHAPGANIGKYKAVSHTHFALGLRFALLRKPFRLLARERAGAPIANGIFICLGGADPNNATLDILKKLSDQSTALSIDLVIGSAYLYKKSLSDFLAHSSLTVTVHEQITAELMAELMAASSYGITSPSTVSLEYLSSGGQLFLYQIAENQSGTFAALIDRGLARDFSHFRETIGQETVRSRPRVIDGLQAARLRKLFNALDIRLRKATAQDTDLYFHWTNDPLVRAQSFNSETVARTDHQLWFERKLADTNTILLLYERDKEPIGQVRLQIKDRIATIGYSMAAAARGAGMGLALLHYTGNYVRMHRPEVDTLVGYVKNDNIASLTTFRRLGYRELPTDDHPNAVKFVLHEF